VSIDNSIEPLCLTKKKQSIPITDQWNFLLPLKKIVSLLKISIKRISTLAGIRLIGDLCTLTHLIFDIFFIRELSEMKYFKV